QAERTGWEGRRAGFPLPGARLSFSLERHFGRGADGAGEARDDVEHALARAPFDVVLEPVPAEVPRAAARVEARARVGEALCETDRRLRRIRVVAVERLDDATRAVRVVERELVEHAGAQHRDVLAVRTRGRCDCGEVEQRA